MPSRSSSATAAAIAAWRGSRSVPGSGSCGGSTGIVSRAPRPTSASSGSPASGEGAAPRGLRHEVFEVRVLPGVPPRLAVLVLRRQLTTGEARCEQLVLVEMPRERDGGVEVVLACPSHDDVDRRERFGGGLSHAEGKLKAQGEPEPRIDCICIGGGNVHAMPHVSLVDPGGRDMRVEVTYELRIPSCVPREVHE